MRFMDYLVFPTHIIQEHLDIPDINGFKKFLESQKRGKNYTFDSDLGWGTHNNLHLEDNQYVNILKEKVIFTLKERFPVEFKWMSMWGNIRKKGSSHDIHTHAGYDWSGVLILDGGMGNIQFINPLFILSRDYSEYAHPEYRKNTSIGYFFEPITESGSILLFPSSIPHRVTLNKSDEVRYSVAFNLSVS